jgi:hypothetical protein
MCARGVAPPARPTRRSLKPRPRTSARGRRPRMADGPASQRRPPPERRARLDRHELRVRCSRSAPATVRSARCRLAAERSTVSPFASPRLRQIRIWRVSRRQFTVADCVVALGLVAVAFIYGGVGAASLIASVLGLGHAAAWSSVWTSTRRRRVGSRRMSGTPSSASVVATCKARAPRAWRAVARCAGALSADRARVRVRRSGRTMVGR